LKAPACDESKLFVPVRYEKFTIRPFSV
jgi:hypothetical protein